MAIVSLDEAKRQLQIDPMDTGDDVEVQAYCDGITKVIEEYKREIIEQREIREDVEVHGHVARLNHQRIRLWSVPVISITSVTSVTGSMSWDVSRLRLNKETGLVRVLSGPRIHGLTEWVYQAGYVTTPDHYKRGALVTLEHNWETRRGHGMTRGGVVGEEERYDHRYSYSIPRKALEWLGAPRPVVG